MNRILAINPGSTSTKIAVFDGKEQLFVKNIKHSTEELSGFNKITDQTDFRKNVILKELEENNIPLNSIEIVIGRGGLVKPIPSGIYEVNDLMKEHLHMGYSGEHASNVGGLIADNIAKSIGLSASYIADPVVVDELQAVARISGHPLFDRKSIFHALNQKAVARNYALEIGKSYETLNLIVAHMGGGISVGAHEKGRVIDVNQALDGEGPFSPERSGTLPTGQLVNVCFSGEYSKDDVKKMLVGKGGYVGYFGINDAYQIEKDAQAGNEKAKLIESAMAYQVAKAIGEAAVVLKGKIDAILLTGGIAYGKPVVEEITRYIDWIAPVKVYPGEDEMRALAFNAYLILTGEAEAENYE
ncbi:MAG: butyrate kinase [Bacteroidetes bacterium]|nr:butyrate kinase [Bacteroidota bacterium]MCL2302672.1 butyrate kinase [Lentimicrobiaceae bacterium]